MPRRKRNNSKQDTNKQVSEMKHVHPHRTCLHLAMFMQLASKKRPFKIHLNQITLSIYPGCLNAHPLPPYTPSRKYGRLEQLIYTNCLEVCLHKHRSTTPASQKTSLQCLLYEYQSSVTSKLGSVCYVLYHRNLTTPTSVTMLIE